jgi:hypothetical protein
VARNSRKTNLEKIFENLLFLADVFGDQDTKDIPKVPFLELALCFELNCPTPSPLPRRNKRWSRW